MIRAFFLLLAVFSQFANAETIPATSGPLTFVVQNSAPSAQTSSVQSSYQAACDAGLVLWQTQYPSSGFFLKACQVANPTAGVNQNYGTARYGYGSSGGEYTGIIIVKSVGYSCPSGQNWTLVGATCTRPDCPAGQPMQPDGTCADKCAPTKDKYTSGWVSYTGASVPTGTVCISGCNYQQNVLLGNDDRIGTDGRTWAEVGQTGLGTSCTGGTQGQTPDEKNKDSKKPPCGAADGVLTTSTGKVLCVPEGTPDARKPGVQKTESKQTGPNGEVTTTEKTTTKDPQTGATHTSTTSTTTNPDGTTKTSSEEKSTGGAAVGGGGSGDNSGNEPGQCAKEPDSPMCKKGTVKEKGQFDSAQGAKLQEAKDQLTAKFNEIKSAASAAFTSSTASGSGTLPCPAPVTVLGKPVSLCVSDYSNQLSVIGAIIVFAAGIIAIFLVVTA